MCSFYFRVETYVLAPLDTIESFEVSDLVALVPPLSQKVLSTNAITSLEVLYTQLYPSKPVEFISHFYIHATKSVIAEELVGSDHSRSKKASVIGAYWPSKGSLATTDHTKLRIGTIQYFLKHNVVMKDDGEESKELCHILCYIKWFIPHPHCNWFGTSAVVTTPMSEVESPLCFMPVQRIAFRCAHAFLKLDLPCGNEEVFVAIPLVRDFHF